MKYHHNMDPLLLDRLLHIADLFQKDMARAFDGTGLTQARVHVLWILQHTGPTTQQALAQQLDVSPRNISGLVDGLEKSGHARRASHPTDRRAVLVELTTTAVEAMTRMQQEHTELNATLLAAIAPEDREAVERGIAALADHLAVLVAEADAVTETEEET